MYLVILFSFGIAILCIRWMFYKGVIRFNYPPFDQFPVQGIDISHYQGDIDWGKLDKKLVQFVFIKATEGKDFKDPKFEDNLKGARQYNIPVSAYHFFTFCSSGEAQANHFIQEAPQELLSLPPVVDLEFGGNCQIKLTDKQLIHEVEEYIRLVEAHYQRKVIIYSIQEFYQAYLVNNFLDNPLWLRDIYEQSKLKNREWVFWQYANRGKIEGINTFVDLNVFNKDKKHFDQYLISSKYNNNSEK